MIGPSPAAASITGPSTVRQMPRERARRAEARRPSTAGRPGSGRQGRSTPNSRREDQDRGIRARSCRGDERGSKLEGLVEHARVQAVGRMRRRARAAACCARPVARGPGATSSSAERVPLPGDRGRARSRTRVRVRVQLGEGERREVERRTAPPPRPCPRSAAAGSARECSSGRARWRCGTRRSAGPSLTLTLHVISMAGVGLRRRVRLGLVAPLMIVAVAAPDRGCA